MTRYRTIVADPPWPYNDAAMALGREVGQARFLSYPTMSVREIAALDVPGMAVADAHLYLWTTQRFVWNARAIAEGWGFSVGPILTWCKAPMRTGRSGSFTTTTEFCLVARRRIGKRLRVAREVAGLGQSELEGLVRGGRRTGLAARWEEGSSYPNAADMEEMRNVLSLDSDFDEMAGPFGPWPTTWFEWKRGIHSAKPEAFLDLVEQVSPGPFLELFARRNRLGWDTWGDEALNHVEVAS